MMSADLVEISLVSACFEPMAPGPSFTGSSRSYTPLKGAKLVAFPRRSGGEKKFFGTGGWGALVDLEAGDSVQRRTQRGKGRPVDASAAGVPPAQATSVDPDLEQGTSTDNIASLAQHTARKAQLAAEDQLVLRLRVQRFKGGEYDRFEAKLVRYALKVLDAWIRHGRIFRECASIGRGLSPTDRERSRLYESPEDREDLTSVVVGHAILRFREEALIGGGWQGSKGASIGTYFMNCVIREFPNHFRAWQREEKRWAPTPLVAVPQEVWLSDPADLVAQRDAVLAELRTLAPSQQSIVALHYDGYSNAQIAEIEGKTIKAVERALERWRERQRQARTRGQDGRL